MAAAAAAAAAPLGASGRLNKFTMTERHLGYLQEMVRKQPESYKEEFLEQFEHYMQTIKLLHLQPAQHRMDVQPLLDSVTFLSGVAIYYPAEAKAFGAQMMQVLREQSAGLDPHVRMAFCKALLPLRNKNFVDTIELLELYFSLVKLEDKHLRKFVLGTVSAQLKRLCTQKRDARLIGRIQNFCFAKLKDSRSIVVRCAQLILVDAYRKKYFRDDKTANAIADCCFHKLPKIQVAAMKFFIGSKEDEEGVEEESDDDEEGTEEKKTIKEIMTAFRHAKKTRKRAKDLEKTKKSIHKKKKAKKESRGRECNLQAIQSIFDPQEFADRLFKMLETKKVEKFEVRLFRLALLARLIGVHRLQTLSFYSYVSRFLQPKQRDVTRILLYAAQACHELVPPEIVEQLVRNVAQNFITDRNSPEAITVGINAVREIFANCPFAATEELLRDLAEYKSYKNKNVSMAARSLVTLFREVNPKLLAKKDRGRPTADNGEGLLAEREYTDFGVPNVADFISGAECLDEEREETGEKEEDEEGDEDSNDGWEDVKSEEEDEEGEDDEANETMSTIAAGANEDVESGEEEEEDEDDDEGWITDEGEEEEGEGDEGEEEESEDEEEEDEKEEEISASATSSTKKTKKSKAELKKEKKAAAAEAKIIPKEKAVKISESRILTQEEFKRINRYKLKKATVGDKKLAREAEKRKRTNDDIRLEEEHEEKRSRREEGDGLPRLRDIEHFHKKMRRETKEERMESIQAGREDRGDYGKPKKGAHVGRTNRELSKKKVYQMVKQKVRGKNRQRSFKDQQESLRKYLLRQSGRKA